MLSLSRSPAVGPWGIPDAPAPDDEDDDDGAADELDWLDVAAAVEVELVDVLELELEPQPATTSAARISAPVRNRRIDLVGLAGFMAVLPR